jgi:hypothetical protein
VQKNWKQSWRISVGGGRLRGQHPPKCGLSIDDLKSALSWYQTWHRKLPWNLQSQYPRYYEFAVAVGFKGQHLWEVNHIKAITEGGDPVDPSNFELLCLRCHRKHTKELAGRRAMTRKKK